MSTAQEIVLSILNDPPREWSIATWSCFSIPLVSLAAVLGIYLRACHIGNTIPGPPSESLCSGNYGEYRRKAGSNRNVSAFYEWLHEKYGPVARYWLGPSSLWISFSDPVAVKDVLQNAAERPPVMKQLLRFLGEENQTFKKQEFARPHRTVLLQHLASPKALLRLGAVARSVAESTAEAWSVHAEQGLKVDLSAELTAAAGKVMTRGLFGEPFERLSAEDKESFMKDLATVADGATKWGTKVVTPFWSSGYREWERSGARLHQVAGRMLKNSRPEDEPNLVAAALRSRHTDGGRVVSTPGEMTSFLVGAAFGGYDTTAMAMCWAVLKMAEHPEVQARVQQELDAVVAGEVPTQEELPRLDYLGAVLLETGRLWPAASALLRCSADTDIKVSGYTVPAGANVVVPIQAIHRSTQAWGDDAREFRPDRWQRTSKSLSGLPGIVLNTKIEETRSEGESAKASQADTTVEHDKGEEARGKVVDLTFAASLPLVGGEKLRPIFTFGGGPRSCVGRLFSLTEQKIMLATLLKRYKVELVPGQGPFAQSIQGFVARPTPSPEVVIVKR